MRDQSLSQDLRARSWQGFLALASFCRFVLMARGLEIGHRIIGEELVRASSEIGHGQLLSSG